MLIEPLAEALASWLVLLVTPPEMTVPTTAMPAPLLTTAPMPVEAT